MKFNKLNLLLKRALILTCISMFCFSAVKTAEFMWKNEHKEDFIVEEIQVKAVPKTRYEDDRKPVLANYVNYSSNIQIMVMKEQKVEIEACLNDASVQDYYDLIPKLWKEHIYDIKKITRH